MSERGLRKKSTKDKKQALAPRERGRVARALHPHQSPWRAVIGLWGGGAQAQGTINAQLGA
eukprot:scaffold14698_cov135-Isochrysis_galbana.AAC.2